MEISTAIISGILYWKGTYMDAGNVLYLVLNDGYMAKYSLSHRLKINALY